MKYSGKYVKDYFLQARIKSFFRWLFSVLLVVMLAFGFAFFFCQSVTVQDSSMEPTLSPGEHLLVNTSAYKLSGPKRGDIIVFRTGKDDSMESVHIKRVIGLPGEMVQIQNGKVWIDGVQYEEEFPDIQNAGNAASPIALSSSEYFLLGDNRNSSEDSRYLNIGNVEKRNIVGKLWFVTSPLSEFGFLKK